MLPCIDEYSKIDLRTVSFDVPPQEVTCITKRDYQEKTKTFTHNWFYIFPQVLTKDSVTVTVDAVVYFRIYNATISVANVCDAQASTRLLAQTTLRNMIGSKNLSEIFGDRETISNNMQVI